MALRRRQGMSRSSTFKEDIHPPPLEEADSGTSTSSLVAQAIMASAAHRDSSHSSAYSNSAYKDHSHKGDHASREASHESGSFWGVLARKAKAILDDDINVPYESEYITQTRPDPVYPSSRPFNSSLRAGLDSLMTTTSVKNRIVENNKTPDFTEETRKIQIKRKGGNNERVPSMQNTSQEDLLKASRDVAMATAAKAKLLLRELKTVKADLGFAKQRCCQLEEENKALREGREKGVFPTDDDMIRVQLETLLAEKGRLAHENSVYARENRFLREVVEYHQLTMHDVMYLDEEGMEEVNEVYPMMMTSSSSWPAVCSVSPPSSPRASRRNSVSSTLSRNSSVAREMLLMSPGPAALPRDAPSA